MTQPTMTDVEVRPFHIDVPEEALVDLRRRIAATRWPDKETVSDRSQGVQLAKLQPLVEYWGTEYDWRKVESTLNDLPQFITTIDGLPDAERTACMVESLGIEHKCRLVVITDFLSDEQMAELTRVTTFYVNTSRAEGACLPLQQSLAAGRPAIAPDHTAMADFMDDKVGFVIGSHPEPTYWPHDPEMRTTTTWNRLVWSDLRDHLLAAAEMAEGRPDEYRAMADSARARMAEHADREVATRALREALGRLPRIETGRFSWAS